MYVLVLGGVLDGMAREVTDDASVCVLRACRGAMRCVVRVRACWLCVVCVRRVRVVVCAGCAPPAGIWNSTISAAAAYRIRSGS